MSNIKHLKKKRSELKVELDSQKQKVAREQKLMSDMEKELLSIDARIESMKINDIEVTDHAIVRYFERVLGYDIDQLKANIIPEDQRGAVIQLKSCKYPIGEGNKAVIKDCVIVSII